MLTQLIPTLIRPEVVHAIQEGGILDWVNDLTADAKTLVISVTVVAALVGALWFAIKAKFSIIAIFTGILAAGLLIGGVLNAEAIGRKFGVEFGGGGGNASGVSQVYDMPDAVDVSAQEPATVAYLSGDYR